jgi:hypothetical protein
MKYNESLKETVSQLSFRAKGEKTLAGARDYKAGIRALRHSRNWSKRRIRSALQALTSLAPRFIFTRKLRTVEQSKPFDIEH